MSLNTLNDTHDEGDVEVETVYELDQDGYELVYSEDVKGRSLLQALQYDVVKRMTINHHQDLLGAWLPDNKPVAFINNGSTRYGFNINKDRKSFNFLSWSCSHLRARGKNLIDLYNFLNGKSAYGGHKYLANEMKLDISGEACQIFNLRTDWRQAKRVTLENRWLDGLGSFEKFGYTKTDDIGYRNRDGSIRGWVEYYSDISSNKVMRCIVQMEYLLAPPPPSGQIQAPQHPNQKPTELPDILLDSLFFTIPYPMYNENGLEQARGSTIIITETEALSQRVATKIHDANSAGSAGYVVSSWPGAEITYKQVDWSSVEGYKVLYRVEPNLGSCRLAYDVYRTIRKFDPISVDFIIEDCEDDGNGLHSPLPNTRLANLGEFFEYVERRFQVSLERDRPVAIDDLKVFTAEEYMALNTAPISHVLAPIVPQPGLVEVFAERGLGKTLFCLELAKQIATGGCAFDRWKADKPLKVLYLDGEMAQSDMSVRLKILDMDNLGGHLKIMSASAQTEVLSDLTTPEGQHVIDRLLDKHKPDVVFLDSLATLAPKSLGNDAECWTPMNNWLLALKRRGISIFIVHHAGKAGDQRGTNAKEDFLDTVISLSKINRGKADAYAGARFRVDFTKARSAYGQQRESFEVELRTSPEEHSGQWHLVDESVSSGQPKHSIQKRRSQQKELEILKLATEIYAQNPKIPKKTLAEQAGTTRSSLLRFSEIHGFDDKLGIKRNNQ